MSEGPDTATVADLCLEASRRSSLNRERPEIEGYELGELLGSGAFGTVYRGVQKSTGQAVAVKVLFTVNEGFREEVERLSRVTDHPNIVTLVDADLDFEPPYLVTPLLQGSLQQHVPETDISRVVTWFEEIARALQFIHGRGILHCDLKPANVLLGEDGQARLVDFGQSVALEGGDYRLGSFWFMPRSQAVLPSSESVVPEVGWDIHALGATIYTLLTGSLPRSTESARQSLSQLETGKEKIEHYYKVLSDARLAPVTELNPKVDQDLAAIVERCLSEESYASASEVVQDLRRRREQKPIKARVLTNRYWLERFLARHKVSAIVGGLAALVLLTGFTAASFEIYKERQARKALIVAQYERGLSLLSQGRSSGLVWLAKTYEEVREPGYRLRLEQEAERQLQVADPLLYRVPTSTAPSPSGTKAIWRDPSQDFERRLLDLTSGRSSPLPQDLEGINLNQKDTVRYRLDGIILDPKVGGGGPATWRLLPSDSVSPANRESILAIFLEPGLLLRVRRVASGFEIVDAQDRIRFKAESSSYSLSAPTFSLGGDMVVGWENGEVVLFDRKSEWSPRVLDNDFRGEIFRFSPDGSLLAGQDRQGLVRIWETEGAKVSEFQLSAQANDLTFDSDGQTLVIVTRDALMSGFQVETGDPAWSSVELEKAARWVFVQANGRVVTMSDEATVWEPSEGSRYRNLSSRDQVALRTGWVYDENARVRRLTRDEYIRLHEASL